jgi:hypothetical protein
MTENTSDLHPLAQQIIHNFITNPSTENDALMNSFISNNISDPIAIQSFKAFVYTFQSIAKPQGLLQNDKNLWFEEIQMRKNQLNEIKLRHKH